MTDVLDSADDVLRTADLSPDGVYRWTLRRTWGNPSTAVTWVMLNPSTADANVDDATIRRCMGFARDWGAGGIVVVNLFALRATDPKNLALSLVDPTGGTRGDQALLNNVRRPGLRGNPVVAAWGAHRFARERAAWFRDWAARMEVPLQCLGTTADGSPRHPLYLPKNAELRPWPPRGE